MKKTDLFQVSASNNFDRQTSSGVPNLTTSQGAQQDKTQSVQAQIHRNDSHGKVNVVGSQGPSIQSLKVEGQHSGSVPAQKSSYSKQLKIQQLYSEQAGVAVLGQPLGGASPRINQTILSAGPNQGSCSQAQTQGPQGNPILHHQHVSAAAHQILQSRQHPIATLPNNQAAGVFTSRDPQFSKKPPASLFPPPTKDSAADKAGVGQKTDIASSAFQQMRSRSPHSSNFLLWGHQQTTSQKQQPQVNPASTSLGSGVSLALKMHTISDSKRHQPSATQAAGGAQTRATPFQTSSVWGGGTNDGQSLQQRAAGKASGLTYTQNEQGKYVDQTNSQQWKSTMEWAALGSEEPAPSNMMAKVVQAHGQHTTNIFSQAGKQQQMNFNSARLKAMQSREGFMNQVATGPGAQARPTPTQFNQYMNTPSQRDKYIPAHPMGTTSEVENQASQIQKSFKATGASSSSGVNLGTGNTMQSQVEPTDQFRVSGGFNSGKFGSRHSMDAQQPKPQLISNQGSSLPSAKRIISNRIIKSKQQFMHDSGLQVMGLPMASIKPDQQLQTQLIASGTSAPQPLALTTGAVAAGDQTFSDDLMEMTPDQGKDKYKKRINLSGVVGQTEAPLLKAPILGKAQPNSVFLIQQDQAIQEHKRHAVTSEDTALNVHQHSHRRAESMGKQKLHSKFSGKAEDPSVGLEGFLQVTHLKQTHDGLPIRGKKSRHHNSFHGGGNIRSLKNAPFKAKQTNSTNSQLNDSGNASGGNTTTAGANNNLTGNQLPSEPKFGLNMTTTLSSEQDSHHFQLIQSSQMKNRRQVAPNNPVIALHPMVQQKGNKHLIFEKPKLLTRPQLSPSAGTQNPSDPAVLQGSGGGEQKMSQLYQHFKETGQTVANQSHFPPPLSPKAVQRTPGSTRKKSKKSKLVLRGDRQLNSSVGGIGAEVLTERRSLQQQPTEVLQAEGPSVQKESTKHRKIKNMIRQNKVVNNLNVSSFANQERSASRSGSEEADFERAGVAPQPHAQQLQYLQKQIHRVRDSSDDEDTLSRDEAATGGVAQAMAIVEGFTPSGLASSATRKDQSSQLGLKSQQQKTLEESKVPKEFSLEESKEGPTQPVFASKDLSPVAGQAKDRELTEEQVTLKEVHKMHPIFSKASLSKEKLRESGSISKHQSSSDESFHQKFEQLIRESDSLKWQFEEILLRKLPISDPVYSEFVDRIVAKNKEREQKSFFKSMPTVRKKDDLIENKLIFERVVHHIENEKRRHSEHYQYRPFHSDMSRSRFLSNSVREDHPSITSPNWSGTAGPTGLRGFQLHYQRHERKRRLHRYLSFSNGVTYHAKSAQQASALLPELSGSRFRNSLQHLPVRFVGVSDSLSQRFHQQPVAINNNSSASNRTVPTPLQHENKKLEDLKEATNRVQILPPQTSAKENGQDPSVQQPQSLHHIYEKLNMNDKKAAMQLNAIAALKQQQPKQENNFFPQNLDPTQTASALGGPQAETPGIQVGTAIEPSSTPMLATEAKKIFGKVIEWQIGKQLGSGTTGEVHEALNIDTGETFAVKMIKLVHPYLGLDQQKVKAVKKEIQRYKQLNHKHLVKYFDSEIIENNVLCIYLEYVYKSLAEMCREYGKIGEKNARMYTHQVLRALIYLHSQNVVHGDLKGANVLVSQDGKEIKLCDMGNSLLLKAPPQQDNLSGSSRSLLSVSSLVYSSPAWMAPETHQQKVGKRSDIWSLGCLVVEMLSGQNPWGQRLDNESSVHTALQRRLANGERPEIPADASEECRDFIDRCLQHDAKVRPRAHQLLEHPWIKVRELHAQHATSTRGPKQSPTR